MLRKGAIKKSRLRYKRNDWMKKYVSWLFEHKDGISIRGNKRAHIWRQCSMKNKENPRG